MGKNSHKKQHKPEVRSEVRQEENKLTVILTGLHQEPKALEFTKYGGFTVDEIIGYELIINNSSQRIINIMLLAKQVAEDLGWSYGEAVNTLNVCGRSVISELIPYAEEIDSISLFEHSDHERKKTLVTYFIQQRIESAWKPENTGKIMRSALQTIYDFMLNEYQEWQELPALKLSDVGKPSNKSEPEPPNIPPIAGTETITGSKPEMLPIQDGIDQTLGGS
jgi:hypothetical protein